MTKRTDTHRPSAIQPSEYEYVGQECSKVLCIEDCDFINEMRRRIAEHMARTGGTWSNHEHGGNCHVCGAHCIYTVLFYHAATNSYIRTGEDCAAKMEMGDERLFKPFRTACQEALANRAGKAKAQAVLANAGLMRAWELRHAGDAELQAAGLLKQDRNGNWDYDSDYATLCDLVNKLVQYGDLSEKQDRFLHVLIGKCDGKKEREARYATERAAAQDCPAGRHKVTGTVLKAEWRDTQFGRTLKITVKDDRGFIVWGTAASGLGGVEVGHRVEFTAKLEPRDDKKFAFASRPAAAKNLTLAAELVSPAC